jgi:hypothetical protein
LAVLTQSGKIVVVHRLTIVGIFLIAWQPRLSVARADTFAIDLTVQAGKTTNTVHPASTDLSIKPKARTIVRAKRGEPIAVTWTVTNTEPKTTYKDVLVHLFVVKEEMLGQPTVPKLDKDVVVETALTMDFKPKEKATGSLMIPTIRRGYYLLRLETIGAANGADGRDCYAALDLEIK